MTTVSRATAAGRAYLDLRALATAEYRLTDELIQLYVLEGFLARLVVSDHAGHLVLKGGVLLAAFGTRRPTRDIDFAALDLDNGAEHVLEVAKQIAAQALGEDDGLAFDGAGAVAEVIRDEEEYSGVRVSMGVTLATARTRFHVDVNVGDPIWPAPKQVEVPRLLGGLPLTLAGYSLPMVHAEKIVTAVQRGTVNTRWRDFGDVWTLSGRHAVNGDQLQTAIARVADHRNTQLSPLRALLVGYPGLAQSKWAAWRRRQGHEHLPPEFSDLLEQLFTFSDPAISGNAFDLTWSPVDRTWR